MPTQTKLNFPLDNQYWMVVWINRVALIENDFFFEVHLTSIDINKFKINFYKSSSYTGNHAVCRTNTEQFSRQAEIGSIWYRRQLVFSPSRHYTVYPRFTTHTITLPQPTLAVSQPLSEMVRRTENIAGFHPFNAPRYSPLSTLLGQSPCLLIDSPHFTVVGRHRTAFLVFPPSELFRFYHCGSSSYLLRQLLSNGLTEDRIYKRRATRYNDAAQQLFVQLRKQVPDVDALLVGRLAGDEVAYTAARDIGRNLQQCFVNNTPAHLTTSFPFAGPTTLRVVGKLFKTLNKDNEWAFFVYSIISCNSTFPFRQLLYSRDNDNTVRTAGASSITPLARRQTGSPELEATSTDTADAAKIKQDVGRQPFVLPSLRFTLAPPFTRIPKNQRPITVPGRIPSWYSRPGRLPILPPHPGPAEEGDVAPEIIPNQEKAPSLSYADFHSIMTGLIQLGLTCYCLTYWDGWARNKYYKDFYLPCYRSLDAREQKWLAVVVGLVEDKYNPGRKKKVRKRRKAVVLQIVYGHATFYLIECEAGLKESFSRMLLWYDQAINLPYTLNMLFPELVRRRGIWRQFPFSPPATTRPLHHEAGETGFSVAQRVFSYIKQILNRYSPEQDIPPEKAATTR